MDELQKILTEVLVVVKDGAAWSAAMAKQEIPLVVEEYLRWGIYQELLTLASWLCVAATLFVTARNIRRMSIEKHPKYRVYAHAVREYVDSDKVDTSRVREAWVLQQVFGVWGLPVVAWTVVIVSVSSTVPTIVKILTAPRIYLLEQLSALVK